MVYGNEEDNTRGDSSRTVLRAESRFAAAGRRFTAQRP